MSTKKKRTSSPRRRTTRRPSAPTKRPRIPPAIEITLEEQRDSVKAAISLVYCLHSTLLHQEVPDAAPSESKAVDDACDMADLTDITRLLLVKLNNVFEALDPGELVEAKVDPEESRLTKIARGTSDSDEREAP
jgi:hypothetical protein